MKKPLTGFARNCIELAVMTERDSRRFFAKMELKTERVNGTT